MMYGWDWVIVLGWFKPYFGVYFPFAYMVSIEEAFFRFDDWCQTDEPQLSEVFWNLIVLSESSGCETGKYLIRDCWSLCPLCSDLLVVLIINFKAQKKERREREKEREKEREREREM
jgi:hypothetical protein